MNIELREITIEKLFNGFADNDEAGVVAYGGKKESASSARRSFN